MRGVRQQRKTDMPEIDNQRLQHIYTSNACARAFLTHAAKRSRNQTTTSVDRALTNLGNEGHEFSRSQLLEVFRELESCGCGTFVVGRRGWPSRFDWLTSMVDVGRAAGGATIEIQPLDSSDPETTENSIDWLTHTFHLRPGVEITFELPMDFTPDEAGRVSSFVQTLPFDQDA